MLALLETARYLKSQLGSNATILAQGQGRVYTVSPGANTKGLYVLVTLPPGGQDVYGAGRGNPTGGSGYRVLTELVATIRACGQVSDFADLEPMAKAIDDELADAVRDNGVARFDSCSLEPFMLEEPDGPTGRWLQLGGIYKIVVSAL